VEPLPGLGRRAERRKIEVGFCSWLRTVLLDAANRSRIAPLAKAPQAFQEEWDVPTKPLINCLLSPRRAGAIRSRPISREAGARDARQP